MENKENYEVESDLENKWTKRISQPQKWMILIFILVILLFLFSTLITIYNLPRVSVSLGKGDYFLHEIYKEATIKEREEYPKYATEDGELIIFVKEGDNVKKGDILFRIERDLEVLQEEKTNLEMDMELKNIDIKNLDTQIAYGEKIYDSPSVEKSTSFDLDLEHIKKKIERAKEELLDHEKLYEAGAITKEKLKEKKQGLFELEMEEKKILRDMEEEKIEKRNRDILESSEKEKEKDVKNENIARLQGEKARLLAEKRQLEEKIIKTNALIEKGGLENYETEINGVIGSIESDIFSHSMVYKNEKILTLKEDIDKRVATMTFDEDKTFIKINDPVTIFYSETLKEKKAKGYVSNIYYKDNMLCVDIEFPSEDFPDAPSVFIHYEKESEKEMLILPNSSIHYILGIPHIYEVEAKKAAFRDIYTVNAVEIDIYEQDNRKTGFYGSGVDKLLVTNSNLPLKDGMEVKLGEDFEEIR